MPTQLTRCTRPERDAWLMGIPRHRSLAFVELLTTVALAVSTAVAAAAVSIGIARADVITSVARSEGRTIALALIITLLLVVLGSVGAVAEVIARRN
jgi:hypothetical protein